MKKYFIAIAVATLAVSCQKIQPEGNKSIIKMEPNETNYMDLEQKSSNEKASHSEASNEEVNIDLNGQAIKAFKGGLEDSVVSFLKSGAYNTDTEDQLKNQWFNFDQINFKVGSADQLLSGQQQIQNLAAVLKAYPNAKIKVGGYTDKTGDETANEALSQKRADFIKSELTKAGVGAQVVSAEGYGSKFAKVPATASNEERASDRKMAIRFTK
ncbi:OmpA family protein [Riemerella columbipharyngis]|uniref:OmpA family protein n=1 Tax=Riemerella columbipharyngis TaxID=1071918 RepID=A0A1G7AB64_9FLAO|nr:OmpA family protein [Riemerella columbipharyngis]SDE11285.1 OmpA family protein [Riemerella columbipharyngis]